ncbi:MAG: dienelactone hydrolase family protein [Myxococcales bacterium]|nr:dienelactone hydrolase family protein [Myxococcales bacterium]
MLLTEDFVDLETVTGPMRCHRFKPRFQGKFPALLLFSEIYQVTEPIQRTARYLAGHGFYVLVPEVYHELEPVGTALEYDKVGTDKGNLYKIQKPLQAYDSDARAAIEFLLAASDCTGSIGTIGMCLGGHLAFRGAMNPKVRAGVCLFATDIHQHSLGEGQCDDSLLRCGEIRGELMMIWGKQDRHVPREGRELIHRKLLDANVNVTWHEFNAQHAFLRDPGYRYNPSVARLCYDLALELFHRKLVLNEPLEPIVAPKP